MEFKELGFDQKIISNAKQIGITKVNLIEEKVIPSILDDTNVLFKTDYTVQKVPGFVMPISDMIVKGKANNVLIIEPTREIAGIVNNYFKNISLETNVKSLVVCGGHDVFREIRDLRKGFKVLIATPGRLMDHLKRATIDINSFDTVIVDNFDKIIQMDFLDQVRQVFDLLRAKRLFIFSRNDDLRVSDFISKYLGNYKIVDLTNISMVDYQKIPVTSENKFDVMHRLLDKAKGQRVIVFTSSRLVSEELRRKMWEVAFKVAKINGETALEERYSAIEDLRTHKKTVLVTTDVLSRSLKFDNLKYVICYDSSINNEVLEYRRDRFGRLDDQASFIEFVQSDEKPTQIDVDDVVKELQEGIKEGKINPKIKFAKMVAKKSKIDKKQVPEKKPYFKKEPNTLADEHNKSNLDSNKFDKHIGYNNFHHKKKTHYNKVNSFRKNYKDVGEEY